MPDLEALIATVKHQGHEPTFSRLLAACGDPRRAAQARFLHREIIGDVETRTEMERPEPYDELWERACQPPRGGWRL